MTVWLAFFLGVFVSTVPSVIFFAWLALRAPQLDGSGRPLKTRKLGDAKCCCGAPLGPDGRCLARYPAENAA